MNSRKLDQRPRQVNVLKFTYESIRILQPGLILIIQEAFFNFFYFYLDSSRLVWVFIFMLQLRSKNKREEYVVRGPTLNYFVRQWRSEGEAQKRDVIISILRRQQ